MMQFILKDRKSILNFFISTDSDINNDVNSFYLSIAGKTITVNGFCEEENVFLCEEFPDYVIPIEFISRKYEYISEYKTFIEIGNLLGFTPQGARSLFNRAIEKTKKIINKDNQKMEYFNA